MKLPTYLEKIKDDPEYQEASKALEYQFLFGNAVLRARLHKGWSQKELAKLVGTKQANISRVETGLANPTLDLITRICHVLDLDFSVEPKAMKNYVKIIHQYITKRNNVNISEIKVSNSFVANQMLHWYLRSKDSLEETTSIYVPDWPQPKQVEK